MTRTLSQMFGDGPVDGLGPHVYCEGCAGSTKTSSVVEGVRRMNGASPYEYTPTTEQLRLFSAIGPTGRVKAMSMMNTAADRLKEFRVDSTTFHKAGTSLIYRLFGNRKFEFSNSKTGDILATLFKTSRFDLMQRFPGWYESIVDTVAMAKVSLILAPDDVELIWLINRFGLSPRRKDFDLIREVLAKSFDTSQAVVDHGDALAWPEFHNLHPTKKLDTLLVDESQDCSPAQLALALKWGHRVIAIGDPRQSLLSFAGAQVDAMQVFREGLTQTKRELVDCELTVSFRCPQAVEAMAQRYAPHFTCHPNNADGQVRDVNTDYLVRNVQPGDRIICRTNAPLVAMAIDLMKAGKPATVAGIDIGIGLSRRLKAIIRKFQLSDPTSTARFLEVLKGWRNDVVEEAREEGNSHKALFLEDQADCLMAFASQCRSVGEISQRLERLFSTDQGMQGTVLLSSIHRVKSQEARNVYVLRPDLIPHPLATEPWQLQQEENAAYVAITRTQENLFFVKD